MAVTGPPQKNAKAGRTTNAGWTEVPDTPYTGPKMNLPDLPGQLQWMPIVEAWWEQISQMPHCVLWGPTDWLFALDLAYLKNDYYGDYFGGAVHANKATEIRRREDQLGTTVEARRKLLIRYVPVDADDDAPTSTPGTADVAGVTSIADRRKRLAG